MEKHDRFKLAKEASDEGLYVPETEHDACGVAFVAQIKGVRSHDVVQKALSALDRLAHRGAVGSDPLTGDGAGILLQIPHAFFRDELAPRGIDLPAPGDYAVAMFFLPNDPWSHPPRVRLVTRIIEDEGLTILGWRPVPIDASQVGPLGQEGMPSVAQLFIGRGHHTDDATFERKLYVARKRIEKEGRAQGMAGGEPFYICSMGTRTVVYKGLLLPKRLARFYPDLADPRVVSALALVHQRYSTNTLPTWERAHPYRFLAHNGEINTLRGNVAAMDAREKGWDDGVFGEDLAKIVPVLDPSGSDSGIFDTCLELLTHTGRSLPHAMMMMIPEAWQKHPGMPADKRAFYEYHASLMEPWDGPACVAFTDGRVIGALLDRNGLRPARYMVTEDDFVVLSSEAGVLDVPAANVRTLDRLKPGRMLLVDLMQGRIVEDEEIKRAVATEKPYGEWLQRSLVRTGDLPEPKPERVPKPLSAEALARAQRAFGYSDEDLRILVGPMGATGKEPVGAMGNDAPMAVFSDRPQLLFAYFRQLFAQVTNPPIDPIREALVMSLRTTLGRTASLFGPSETACRQIELSGPILTNELLLQLRDFTDARLRATTLSTLFRVGDGAIGLRAAIANLCASARREVEQAQSEVLILSDRAHNDEWAPIPSLLALTAVREHLRKAGLGDRVSIVIESGEPREIMHFALLLGYGAAAVNPYLALDTVVELARQQAVAAGVETVDVAAASARYIHAVEESIEKVLSKMGISTLQSYRGGKLFEAIGLSTAFVAEFFPGTASRLGGIDLDVVAEEAARRHHDAYTRQSALAGDLATAGVYKWRRGGEHHAYNPNTIGLLQHAVRSADYGVWKKFTSMTNAGAADRTIRGLLTFKPRTALPIDEVEPVSEIVKRFRTGAMSFGSISKEAHETIAIAMNRLGGRSNSGEGGEDPARNTRDENGDSRRSGIKQVASGRFGVTSEYLTNAAELQIKMAQGAKPGEGGQLPGHKVDEVIARTRYATKGVGLISPPPHHDIYSIEDLAQLIFDLRNANRDAKISVKLVSEVGVGTVAAGVAKANADVILISGDSGGTGAAPLSSIKHAGVPWELGIAEAQQVLVMNDLRGKVMIEVDGQLKTGRDVVMGALLGAELFGFGTAALVAAGCVLMRVCHLNTCPVGVATQDPELRARFAGQPDHVMNFMLFVAEEVREIMAELGFRSFEEMVGRVDILGARTDVTHWKAKELHLAALLHTPNAPTGTARHYVQPQDKRLDGVLDWSLMEQAKAALESGEPVEIKETITNEDRTACTMLSSQVTRNYGPEGLPKGTIRIHFDGIAGQSFAAFLTPGLDVTLRGAANDSFAKGMCGGHVIVSPPDDAGYIPEDNIIVGNVALYGATGGTAFIHGIAGERFAVRNSGATAVVEGVGDHACEYMTGGTVVILGRTGRNFAAGMTGGVAYVVDVDGRFADRVNPEMVDLEKPNDDDVRRVQGLIHAYYERTQSARAWRLLAGFAEARERIVKVVPREWKKAMAASAAEAKNQLRVVQGG